MTDSPVSMALLGIHVYEIEGEPEEIKAQIKQVAIEALKDCIEVEPIEAEQPGANRVRVSFVAMPVAILDTLIAAYQLSSQKKHTTVH